MWTARSFIRMRDSQRAVGDALKGWRDKIIVSTKNPLLWRGRGEWVAESGGSLERLQVECIDLYNCHAMNSKTMREPMFLV